MLVVDLVAHRHAHVIGVREAARWSVFWVMCGVGFGALVWSTYGAEFGQQYFRGRQRVRVGRGAFIAAGSSLIASFSWVLYLFAAFLLYTGWTMLRRRHEHLDPEQSRALRMFRRWVPMTDAYHGQRFLLADLIHRFVYLKVGLALVLLWVGVKMLLKIDLYYIPTTVSLAVVALILGASVVASLVATRGQSRQAVSTPARPPFRLATEEELATASSVWRGGKQTASTG